ncbi:MAG: hypothetical protein OXG46_02680 [Chloroflexi bacterium]|nr:hypothetical protein [Chloroflexota bacterium]MCY3937404.1 hypothetical protein [Chloroflexota bacterium]
MTLDPSVVPGLLFLLAELVALAGFGYVIVRVALQETDDRVALAQGLVVGPAIWGVVVNIAMYALPGMVGAVAGWIFMLALAVALIWRTAQPVRPSGRTVAIIAAAAIALFAVALASRQMLTVPNPYVRIGLSASIRAGVFPPEFPWNPGSPVPYHYGVNLLTGLLAPPSGPDLAFVEELLGAYAWVSLSLVVATALLRRGSTFAALAVVLLLFTYGAWTLRPDEPDGLLEVIIPAGIPAAGLRASLMDIYWPSVELPYSWRGEALPNIWKPIFPLSYALALVVLARAARAGRRSWLSMITLGALIGFLGLLSTSLAPMVFVLWAGLEAVWLVQCRRAGVPWRSDLIRSASGLALVPPLLLAGTFSYLILGDSAPIGLSLERSEYSGGLRLLGSLDRLPGGVGVLWLGPLAAATAAVLLARRERLVWALAVGAGLLALASLLLNYEPKPRDIIRIEGHARNFALFALLIALSVRLAALRPERWRYAAGAMFVGLIVWPTIIVPVRNLGLAVGQGIEVANAGLAPRMTGGWFAGRYRLPGLPDRIKDYIRDNTAPGARVFSPRLDSMTFNTGRPNAYGFAGLTHLSVEQGPEYRDVREYLDPGALHRLGFEYVHAPDSWVENLPDEAAERLNDPSMFELLVRDTSESLYRVLPAFLTLDAPPAPGSYEALRRAVPASATVLLPSVLKSTNEMARTAWALSHARLLGAIDPAAINLRVDWYTEPLGDRRPDLVITPARFEPWMFPAASRQPIWWNDETAVYALDGAVDPIMPSPPSEQFPFSVRVSDVTQPDGRIDFTATFDDRAPEGWTSQDWILIATEAPPWDIPTQLLPNDTPAMAMWFDSFLTPGKGTTSLSYNFDFHAPSLSVRREHGVLKPLDRSEGILDSGSYVLAVRLRHEYEPEQWRDAAVIRVLRITVSDTGDVSYQIYEDVKGGEPAS